MMGVRKRAFGGVFIEENAHRSRSPCLHLQGKWSSGPSRPCRTPHPGVLWLAALASRAAGGRRGIGSRQAVMTITYRSAPETVKESCVCPADRWKRRPDPPWETPAEDGCEGDVMLNAMESSAGNRLADGQTLLWSAADGLSRLSSLPLARQQGIWMGRQAPDSPPTSFSAQATGSTGAVRCASASAACSAGEDCLGSARGHSGAGADCCGHGCAGEEKHGSSHSCCGQGGQHAGPAHGHCGSGGDCGGHGHQQHRAGHGCRGGREGKHASGHGSCGGGGECAGR